MKGKAVSNGSKRRQIAYVGAWNTILLDLRNPYIITYWSISFAGFGHILLDRYFRGFILITSEILLNKAANLNVAIYYTLTKQFVLAKQALDIGWLIAYLAVYCFAIFDSYRDTVMINNTYILAAREDVQVNCFAISSGSFNSLNAVPPWMAMFWSAILPGAGSFLTQRMNKAIYLMSLWIITAYLSGLYPAILHTFAGEFALAKSSLDIHWLLNVPSLWFFAAYEAYACTVENNKLFRWELGKFLKTEYQSKQFIMPDRAERNQDTMYLVSNFEYSNKLEAAITELQMRGIPKTSILAIPLDKRNEGRMLFDSVHSSDGVSMMAFPLILAMIGTFFGLVYGFQLTWGPILWGVIGAVSGFVLGLALRLLLARKNTHDQNRRKKYDAILIVRCEEGQANMVEDALWTNAAMGVSQVDL